MPTKPTNQQRRQALKLTAKDTALGIGAMVVVMAAAVAFMGLMLLLIEFPLQTVTIGIIIWTTAVIYDMYATHVRKVMNNDESG